MKANRATARVFCARAKVVTAAIAAGVVVAMSALTVALSGTEARAVPATVGGAGDTSTQAPPPSTAPVSRAAPTVIAPKWQGNGWPGQ
jgi:hypothetical protein